MWFLLPISATTTAPNNGVAKVFRVREGQLVQGLTLSKVPPTLETQRRPPQSCDISIVKHCNKTKIVKFEQWCKYKITPKFFGHFTFDQNSVLSKSKSLTKLIPLQYETHIYFIIIWIIIWYKKRGQHY